MPYSLQRSGFGFYVVNQKSGRRLSKKPLSRQRAISQMRAVQAREGGYKLDCSLKKNQKYISCQRQKLRKSRRIIRKNK